MSASCSDANSIIARTSVPAPGRGQQDTGPVIGGTLSAAHVDAQSNMDRFIHIQWSGIDISKTEVRVSAWQELTPRPMDS